MPQKCIGGLGLQSSPGPLAGFEGDKEMERMEGVRRGQIGEIREERVSGEEKGRGYGGEKGGVEKDRGG